MGTKDECHEFRHKDELKHSCHQSARHRDMHMTEEPERVRAGLARRKAAGLPVGRQPGSKDRAGRKQSGYRGVGAGRQTAGARARRRADERGMMLP
jgi:hypothetical protein